MAYEHLKKLLEKNGKSQEDLAKLIGRTPAVVTNLFKGRRSLQTEEVEKIARHFDVSTDYVMYGKDVELIRHTDEVQRESELAIIYVLKVILQIMMQHQMVSTKGLDFNFSEALTFYHGRKLGKAAQIMEKLRVFVAEEPRVLEQAINRILLEPEPQRPA